MTNKLKEYIPEHCINGPHDLFLRGKVHKFDTIEDLRALDYVKGKLRKGYHLAVAGNTLMQVSDDEHWWSVIGFLANPVDLPKWLEPRGFPKEGDETWSKLADS